MDFVLYQDNFVFRHISPSKMHGDLRAGLVGRGVVDDDHPIVGIVLLQDRLQVPGIPEIYVIVVGGSHDACM